MTNIENNKTLCCSNTCKKRFECNENVINHSGTYLVEDWSNFGSGIISMNECKTEYWCGELGDYKMFRPLKITKEEVIDYREKFNFDPRD